MSGEIHTYKPKASKGYKPKCYCKDFSNNVGNMKLVCCTNCGRVWVGSGSPEQGGYMPTKIILDLNYLREQFSDKF